ncbi:AraC family transcriptional regulator [Neptunitalea lumnitzerae]|uniref:AraC family transcriptional regulator n=1 Tax=Neptunitalea lumnitzerae TaxID=2965509 RepID=A0ABQ5MI32_9FLAO|nr:helix-turn-helix domain-containing protein [Neptunitalea sp. Y10]GLB49086.1 AraC family transcriptional regulator [Neptunitalea sp. Y10]
MESIKTYNNVNKTNPAMSFGISRTEDIYVKHQGKPDTPHRHDFYTVLLVKTGKGTHTIDFKEFKIEDHQVFFLSPGQVHQVIEEKATYGYSMVFSSQFLIENNIPLSFIDDLNLFYDYGESPPLKLQDNQLEKLTFFAEEMLQLYKSDTPLKDFSIGSYLKLFLIQCTNLCSFKEDNLQKIETGNHTLKEFKNLVEHNYKKWHATSTYAEALNITPDHLNRTIKSLIGKTAKEYIQSRLDIEAKRMLYFSDLTTKEIGYELGFSEPSHFSSFFKKCTGHSPSSYKKSI